VTKTGLNKSTADVPMGVQDFLTTHGIHDFAGQKTGPDYIVQKKASVGALDGKEIEVRLGRPRTHNGKFRRISLTKELVDALELEEGDRIGFAIESGKLIVFKRSDEPDGGSPEDPDSGTSGDGSSGNAADAPYPNRFTIWFGRGTGSVKRPFVNDSGRPLGKMLETPLIQRLRTLAKEIAKGKLSPSLLILAGGAGNGKSDGLEEFLRTIATESGKLDLALSQLEASFHQSSRVVEIEASVVSAESCNITSFVVIQDATEGDETGKAAGELLATDLERLGNHDDQLIILCVNRGVLEEARIHAEAQEMADVIELLRECTRRLDPTNLVAACWPMDEEGTQFMWPLDVESLCQPDGSAIEELLRAVSEGEWDPELPAEKSAVHFNRELISSPVARGNIAKLLRHHEIFSGKRWSFRELFHLVAHLLSGGTMRRDEESPLAACQRLVLPKPGEPSPSIELKQVLDALRATIPQALFPQLPGSEAISRHLEALMETEIGDGLSFVPALKSYLGEPDRLPRSVVEEIINSSFGETLDPVRGLPREWRGPDGIEAHEIDGAFNLSVETGLRLLVDKGLLDPVEIRALELLAKVECELDELAENDGMLPAELLAPWRSTRCWIRRLAALFAKRALVVQAGAGRVSAEAEQFMELVDTENTESIKEEARKIRKVLAPSGEYDVPLALSLAQPRGTAKVPPLMRVSPPLIKAWQPYKPNEKRPTGIYREFPVKTPKPETEIKIPYTIQLFMRLRALDDALLEGCLDAAKRGCLDQIRLVLDGQAVRGWGGNVMTFKIDLGDERGPLEGDLDDLEFNGEEVA
jgi:hypothetical protein